MLLNLWKKWFEPKPFNEGYLPSVDGHDVWFAEYGNPAGKTVLCTHGGPGGSCKAYHAKSFNLKKYRVVMFDQRGCGKSRPLGLLQNNTTVDILADMERLLEHLKIDSPIILRGGSWASTIALLFAEKHPQKVEKMILSQIFLADSASEKWEQELCGMFYPDMLGQLKHPLVKGQTIPEYYLKELLSENTAQQKKALETYGTFERVLGDLSPRFAKLDEVTEKNLTSTRIYAQYAVNHYYIKDNEIINNLDKIKHIPTLIVHNRLDMLCPLQGAYNLAENMDNAKLVIVPEKGHVGNLLYKTLTKEIKKFCP